VRLRIKTLSNLHSVPRIAALITLLGIRVRALIIYEHEHVRFKQFKHYFDAQAVFWHSSLNFFSKFLQVKNRVYQWNMKQNYRINFFDYEDHDPWHTWYNNKNHKLTIFVNFNFNFEISFQVSGHPLLLTVCRFDARHWKFSILIWEFWPSTTVIR